MLLSHWPWREASTHFGIGCWDNPDYNAIMTARLRIDNAGRIVLPEAVCRALEIGPADVLELENVGERVTLRPVRCGAPIAQEKGVWVFRAGQPLAAFATDDLLEQIREQRDKQHLSRLNGHVSDPIFLT